jgi:hypothetical protein
MFGFLMGSSFERHLGQVTQITSNNRLQGCQAQI